MIPRIVYIFGIFILIAAMIGSYIIGSVRWHERGRNESPAIGYLQFNTKDPTKEFLELHITQDIDISNPPEYVRLLILVNKEEGNGSKT